MVLGHWFYFLLQIFTLHHFPGKPVRPAEVSDTPQFTILPGLHPQIQAHVLETYTCLSSDLYCWIGWILAWVLVYFGGGVHFLNRGLAMQLRLD